MTVITVQRRALPALLRPLAQQQQQQQQVRRQFHASPRRHQSGAPPAAATETVLGSRWLSDLRAEAERLSSEGKGKEAAAREVLRRIEGGWLELLAGSEGFLVERDLRGLDNYPVAWGEMVRFLGNVCREGAC